MKRTFLSVVVWLFCSFGYAQLSFEPNRPLFAPLLADAKEPRIAILPNQNNDELSLDIGVSLDLLQLSLERRRFGVGVDFGTFSELRREWNFKFPVNAVDYLFGMNVSYRAPLASWLDVAGRFRLSHISAHLVDGRFAGGGWIEGLEPFTYSREFVALTLALSSEWGRAYAGCEVLFNVIPRGIAASSYQAGVEFYCARFPLSALAPFAAIDFRLVPIWRRALGRTQGYGGATNVQMGIKLNAVGKRGMRIAFNHYGGLDFRGMYLGRYAFEQSVGVLIDF
ncbi:MAG: DUF1207 domain-containing protein [Chloroherpetonaceae bacterium]|nr:DUF1207 domain-containing protein [Chloroherpetonaceae bacterium]MDW8436796.1 hypothetical protein [Chloroherpetonaceae bacterium]